MKTKEKNVATDAVIVSKKNRRALKTGLIPVLVLTLLTLSTGSAKAHCDTMDGPVIKDAVTAFEMNNVNIVLKWVLPAYEAEVKEAFALAVKVRKLGGDAKTLAERYFFETLVRLHRSGEGVQYTGLKPAGTPLDEKILAADKAVETGDLSVLSKLVPREMMPELHTRFEKVMALKTYDANNVKAGREYIEAYVQFFKYAEGDHHEEHGEAKQTGHSH